MVGDAVSSSRTMGLAFFSISIRKKSFSILSFGISVYRCKRAGQQNELLHIVINLLVILYQLIDTLRVLWTPMMESKSMAS